MKTELLKRLGVILSAVWLLIVGYFVVQLSFFAEGAPKSERQHILSDVGFTYFLVGLLPLLGFIFVRKIFDDPLSKTTLIFLALLAVIPMLLFLLVIW